MPQKYPAGSVIEGPVVRLTKFGAFARNLRRVSKGVVQHLARSAAEKRVNHPQDVLKVGQIVKAQFSRSMWKSVRSN